MPDSHDYSRARSYGTIEHHGLTFKIAKPKRRKYTRSTFILVFDGMAAAGSATPQNAGEARTYFTESLERCFPDQQSLKKALANLHVRGGATIY